MRDQAHRTPTLAAPLLPGIDPAEFRRVLGRFATGVVAVTAIDAAGRPAGMAVNSFTSVSLAPPLVAFCVAHTSTSWPSIRNAGRCCLNILGGGQRPVSAQFAARGTDKFAGLSWSPAPSGSPLLADALAWLDCAIDDEHTAGDHDIVVARVDAAGLGADRDPLVFFGSRYGTFDAG
ncbi:flavin reductase (DIM6/NTAB) family NADH-FMN oxidoreductase RutF [Nocardiopsis mwathae]|uniref:Flavin reductase (DIM6/NTAB) family NADH-FMN oxidoreductase RutF n=1 Tax=Nocardiopsis mwathae TaxID=1472723 RepID=A0A7W9YN19_9ACTN|nr:flavin reductase family protein [Nocardiopsis mwathae]MBB6174541.1 flavin reductase (DIM6/NTAB) family NADH-FMN oxidoreductase RutF [Nocardiopsis mwathae]